MQLKLLEKDKTKEFKTLLQEAFQYGFESYTGKKEEQVLPESHMDSCLNNPNCYAYMMVDDDNEILGGCIVTINKETNVNILDFMFVKVGVQSKGIGQQIWKEIEILYPNTKIWETCTPYFDVRNIHYYVNKLKFHIVEFYNHKHPDPNFPDEYSDEQFVGMFKFIKNMKVGE